MSRIHEALKKAERERAAIPVEGIPTEASRAIPFSEAPHIEASNGREIPTGGAPAQPALKSPAIAPADRPDSDFLRFDDLRKRCACPEWHFDPNVNIFANPGLSEHGAEQFRTLRSRLYQAQANQPLRTLLITSSVPGEGKTFVTANLAQAIVRQPDRRALVIDGDLRRPRLHAVLGAPSTPGLTDYLRGEADEIAIIQNGPENLCMIPGGTEVSNPSELLSNDRLKLLLARLRNVFDWIILDSPPCLPVADATILGGLCDGVLLVVRAGATPSSVAERARLELKDQNIVGVVLNSVEANHLYGSDYYYQRYGYSRDTVSDAK